MMVVYVAQDGRDFRLYETKRDYSFRRNYKLWTTPRDENDALAWFKKECEAQGLKPQFGI